MRKVMKQNIYVVERYTKKMFGKTLQKIKIKRSMQYIDIFWNGTYIFLKKNLFYFTQINLKNVYIHVIL